jgi:hypothetical protein
MQRSRIPFGILSIFLVLLLNLLTASPALHELIHKDADKAGHECAVTVFAHGQVDAAVSHIFIAEPSPGIEFAPVFPAFVFSATIANLPSGRAPPVSA